MITTRTPFKFLAIALLASAPAAFSQVASRIAGDFNDQARVILSGTESSAVARSVDAGRVAADRNLGRMLLMLAPSAQQEAAAKTFVKALHDASSPQFHKWLTPAAFGDKFGISADDAARVRGWLESQGLTVHEVAQSRRFVVFSGTVAQVEHAFATEMHSYSRRGQTFIANSREISVPAALAPVVKGVVRLNSDPPRSQSYMGKKVHWDPTSGHWDTGDGSHYLSPADFAKIYNLDPLYAAGIDGAGQSIAIVGRSNIFVDDIHQFRELFHLPENDPEVIVNGDDPGQTGGDLPEATLDVTWAGAVAPNAHIYFVVSQSNFSDGIDVSASYIVDHNLAPVMSTSYGICEAYMSPVHAAFYNALWQQASAQGITAFVSSGDNGGAGCDEPGGGTYAFNGVNVSGLASTPYNVAVGGTQFDDTADPDNFWLPDTDPATGASVRGYISEKVWNESSNDPNLPGLWAGSGGVSALYQQPDWQTVAPEMTGGMRGIPDISLNAALHDGYLVCLFNNCSYGEYFYVFGGTSASSPAAAGIMALVNQKMGGQPQGIANYVLYRLASTPGIFHDTASGNNKVPDASGLYTVGYDAAAGYDLATGLGSFDANALVNNWAAASSGNAATIALTLAPGQPHTVTHGTPVPLTATVKCSGAACPAPTGDVTFSAMKGSNFFGLGGASLSPSSTGSVANFTTSAVPGGSYSVMARYGGDGTYFGSTSNAIGFTVTPEPSYSFVGSIGGGVLTTAPITVSYGEPLSMGAIVAGNSGAGYPSGTLTVTVDGAPATPIAFNPGSGLVSPSPLKLNYGENSAILLPGYNTQSQSSVVAYLPTFWANDDYPSYPSDQIHAGSHVVQVSYPGDASFAANSSNAFVFNVAKADIFIADFFPLGTQVANVPVHLMGQLAFANQWFGNFTGTITISDLTSGSEVVLGSAPVSMLYGGSYDVPVTITTPGNSQCGESGTTTCHVLRVSFSGDRDTNAAAAKFYVPFPSTSNSDYVSLWADVPTAVAGTPIHLSAQVASDVRGYVPTGTTTFYDSATSLGSATLDDTGTATLVVSNLAPGTHTNITAMYSGDAVLAAVAGGPLTESVQDYTLQADPSTITLATGASGSATISVLPLGGSTQTVAFSCGSPAHITCSFEPDTLTMDGTNSGTVTIHVTIDASTAAISHLPGFWGASGVAFACMLLPFWRRKRMKSLVMMGSVLLLVLHIASCGSSSTSKPVVSTLAPGTYVVNITANGGSGTTAKTLPLVINVTN